MLEAINPDEENIQPVGARCRTCAFAMSVRPEPTALQSVLICKRCPPTPIFLPLGGGQYRQMSTSPIVAPDDRCGMYLPASKKLD